MEAARRIMYSARAATSRFRHAAAAATACSSGQSTSSRPGRCVRGGWAAGHAAPLRAFHCVRCRRLTNHGKLAGHSEARQQLHRLHFAHAAPDTALQGHMDLRGGGGGAWRERGLSGRGALRDRCQPIRRRLRGGGRSGGSWGAAPGRPAPSLAPVPPDQALRGLAARTAGTRRFPPPLKLACSTSWGVTCRGCSGAGREP